ncbi:MAG: trypsin-like peptidase domain-containing protein [Actinobacteria bacterium]|nr:trypsin-like peptidase domain-containing protein [Actinomycetota bacterium]
MAPAEGTPAPPRAVRWPLVAAGVVILALVVAVAVLAVRGGSDPKAAPTASPSASPTSSPTPTVSQIYQRVGPSVAVVRTAGGALGSGVIASTSGAVVTANHVIADGTAITIIFADGTQSSATVASTDPASDIAVLAPATLPQPIVPATIGGNAAVGSAVVAIGNPLGLTYSVSAGVVSGLDRTAKTDSGQFSGLIQFDASVNPGSSGGPLLDGKGNVIGIVISIADPGGIDAFAGIAFAVPIGAALGGGGGGAGNGNGPQI